MQKSETLYQKYSESTNLSAVLNYGILENNPMNNVVYHQNLISSTLVKLVPRKRRKRKKSVAYCQKSI